MDVVVSISPGEWFDKISILMLKVHRLGDEFKRIQALKNMYVLMDQQDLHRVDWKTCKVEIACLFDVNGRLWDLENSIRSELDSNNNSENVCLMIGDIHDGNTERAELKQLIDERMESQLAEVKDYG